MSKQNSETVESVASESVENQQARPRQWEHPLRSRAETALIRSFGATFERASWEACRYAGAWLGLAFYGALKKRRRMATDNVRLAFPHLSEAAAQRLARRSMQNSAMTFCEFLHQRAASRDELEKVTSIRGLQNIEAGFTRGRGVILLMAHVGNWELLAARLAQEFPLTIVARPVASPGLQEHLTTARQNTGLKVLSKYAAARGSMQILRANGALGILPDQHGGPEGLLLPMFGHLTRVVQAPARLALMSGALIVPAYGVRRAPWLADGRIDIQIFPGFEVAREDTSLRGAARDMARHKQIVQGTEQGIIALENIVRRNPDQWLWGHKRWREEDWTEDSAAT